MTLPGPVQSAVAPRAVQMPYQPQTRDSPSVPSAPAYGDANAHQEHVGFAEWLSRPTQQQANQRFQTSTGQLSEAPQFATAPEPLHQAFKQEFPGARAMETFRRFERNGSAQMDRDGAQLNSMAPSSYEQAHQAGFRASEQVRSTPPNIAVGKVEDGENEDDNDVTFLGYGARQETEADVLRDMREIDLKLEKVQKEKKLAAIRKGSGRS